MELNVYTWLFIAFFLLCFVALFFWGGPFLLLPMAVRLSLGLGAVTALSTLGILSKFK